MTPELTDRLRERLAVRADRLAKMSAAVNCQTVVLALFAAHVTTTALLLLGKAFADQVFEKLLTAYRESSGICMCGEALKADDQPLCQGCLDQVEAEDRDCEEQMAMLRPAKGQPS